MFTIEQMTKCREQGYNFILFLIDNREQGYHINPIHEKKVVHDKPLRLGSHGKDSSGMENVPS